METKYIKISYPEKVYSKKHLLYAELETVNAEKKIIEFKKLRRREALLKIQLKSKSQEALLLIKKLNKQLQKKKEEEEKEEITEESQDVNSLDLELERIQRKLAKLQAE